MASPSLFWALQVSLSLSSSSSSLFWSSSLSYKKYTSMFLKSKVFALLLLYLMACDTWLSWPKRWKWVYGHTLVEFGYRSLPTVFDSRIAYFDWLELDSDIDFFPLIDEVIISDLVLVLMGILVQNPDGNRMTKLWNVFLNQILDIKGSIHLACLISTLSWGGIYLAQVWVGWTLWK